jgi:hypothetical protein
LSSVKSFSLSFLLFFQVKATCFLTISLFFIRGILPSPLSEYMYYIHPLNLA